MSSRLLALLLIAALSACSQHTTVAPSTSMTLQRGDDATVAAGERVAELDARIIHIFQATDSTYWFGSDGQGVYRYDDGGLVRFTTAHGLASDRVRSIQEDCAGNIFVCSDPGGVSRFDCRVFSKLSALNSSKSEWKLAPDDLWFPGGQDSGVVYRWDGTSLHRMAFPTTAAGDAHFAALPRSKFPHAKYSPYDVYTIFKDSKGHLWFGTSTLGACRYDGTNFDWVGLGENGSFGVRSFVEDKDGTFWLSNAESRFVENLNAASEPGSSRFRKELGVATADDPYSVFMSTVRDKDGILWIATLGSGVFRYDGSEWTAFPVLHDGKAIWVYSIYQDRQGALWLGTQEHGVYKFNENAKTFERFRPMIDTDQT